MANKLDEKQYFKLMTDKLREIVTRPVKLMEVCGTHTMAISRTGIRGILPPEVELISGPGCPVCVTADADIDAFMRLAKDERVVLATYGDMVRVPGTDGSLAELKAHGADVRVVYSVFESLTFAKNEPNKEVVFLGVGFETTTPAAAQAVQMAKQQGVTNFSVYNLHKTVPEALKLLLDDVTTDIDGFILPGHVSVIIGEKPYEFLAKEYGASGVIVGFHAPEMMSGILKIVQDVNAGTPTVTNLYRKVVRSEGNVHAQKLLNDTFVHEDAEWRGIGVIPGSGLGFREELEAYDAAKKFKIERRDVKLHKGCSCGNILKGTIKPYSCPLFAKRCTPEHPVGPCMVSSEGTCAAYYLYDTNGGERLDG